MKHLITYGLVFVGSMALSAVGGYLLVPAKHAEKAPVEEKHTPLVPTTSTVEDGDFEEEEIFVPKESTPVDYLIDGLLNTKALDLNGDISIKAFDYDISLSNFNAYLTLETFTDIEACVNANIEFHNEKTPISVSYVDGSIYLSLLGNDIKMATDDFADVMSMIDSFGVSIEMPDMFSNVDLDSIMDDMASMEYSPLVEGGYEFTLNLFGLNIYLTCDTDYYLSSAKVSGEIEGINLDVDVKTNLHQAIEKAIECPENETRPYQAFNSFIPFVKDFARLAGEQQFGVELSASLKQTGAEDVTSFVGDFQFDVEKLSGEGNLQIVDYTDKTYVTPQKSIYPTHNLTVNIEDDDMKFKYNDGMYGKFNLQTIKDLAELVTTFLESDNPINLLLNSKFSMPDLNDTTIMHLINGEFELLFNDYIHKLSADETTLDVSISKDLIGIDSDIELIVNFDKQNHIQELIIPTVCISGMEISLNANFKAYDSEYELLPSETEVKYFDFSEIKFLLSIGLNTATISNFHLVGNISMPMKLGDLNLSGLVGDMPIDMQIYNDMSDVSTRVIATVDNIPSIIFVNSKSLLEDHKKLQLVFDNEYIYLTRYDMGKRNVISSASTKVTPEELMSNMNILKYLLGFGFGFSDSIMSSLVKELTKPVERTSPLDYSKIFNDYLYSTNETVTKFDGVAKAYERNWFVDVNIAELANNDDLKSLSASIYGGHYEELEGDFLQYIAADFAISAGGFFNLNLKLDAELVDIDPSVTPSVFKDMQPYIDLLDYVSNHSNDTSLTFNY